MLSYICCKISKYLDMFNLTSQVWFSMVCTLIDNDTRHHSGQNVVDSRGAVAFTTTSTSKKMFFQSTSWERHCATHWREQRCLGTLIDNGKLADRIARLAAIVVKHIIVQHVGTFIDFWVLRCLTTSLGSLQLLFIITVKKQARQLLKGIVAGWWNSNHGLSCCIGRLQGDLSGSRLVIYISCLKVIQLKEKIYFNSFILSHANHG